MSLETYAEMHLVFDNDYDVRVITELTKIMPYNCQRKCETRINSKTQKHNPGFWTVRSDTFSEPDINIVIDNLISKVEGGLFQIRRVCNENQGKVVFDIVPIFDSNNVPAIYFNKDFLDIVCYLNAEIQLDMYMD